MDYVGQKAPKSMFIPNPLVMLHDLFEALLAQQNVFIVVVLKAGP